jgi:hypothetical protein
MSEERGPRRVPTVREGRVAPFAERLSDEVVFRLSPALCAADAALWNRHYAGGLVQVPSEAAPRVIPRRPA